MQEGPCPTIARLSDPEETAGFAVLAHAHSGLRAPHGLGRRPVPGLEVATARPAGVVSCSWATTAARRTSAPAGVGRPKSAGTTGGLPLGRRAGESWKRERFASPYLRDTLLGVGVMVDTLETVTTWSNLLPSTRR